MKNALCFKPSKIGEGQMKGSRLSMYCTDFHDNDFIVNICKLRKVAGSGGAQPLGSEML